MRRIWMYGWVEGELWGSPDAVIGNRRDIVEDNERRKYGMVAGCGILVMKFKIGVSGTAE